MKNKKHLKLTTLAAMAFFFAGAGVACTAIPNAKAQAEIAKDSIVTVTTSDGVTTGYADFESALNNADGGMVTLLQNVELSQAVTTYISYTLDLNGYSITNTNPSYATVFEVNGGEMKIIDSSQAQTGTVYQANNTTNSMIYVQSSLVVEGGIFVSKHAVISSYGDVTITINGGTFDSGEYCDYLFTDDGGGTITFNGGTYADLCVLDLDYEKNYAYLADCLNDGMCYGVPLEEQQTKIEGNVTVQPHNYVDNVCACGDQLKLAVTADGETKKYKDIESAINAANKTEGAKLTLLADVDGGEKNYWVETVLTVDVAGYTLSGTSLSIDTNGEKAAIILEDNSAEQTGKIIGIEGSKFSSLHSGSLTVNSGNFENVDFSITNFATEASFIQINAGTFDCLNVDVSVGSASIYDFVATEILIYNMNGGVEVKGGTFQYADIRESTMQDILADGYKLVDQDGTFVDCNRSDLGMLDWDAENNEYIYYETFTVVEHKTCTYEMQYDETKHWQGCACGAREEGSVEEHKGGEASCILQAVCEVCNQKYGEFGDHVVQETWEKDDTHHWKTCAYGIESGLCQEKFEYAEHVYGDWVETKPATETEMGEKTKTCACGQSITEKIPMIEQEPAPETSETPETSEELEPETSETPETSEEPAPETSETPETSEELEPEVSEIPETSASEEESSGGGCGSSVAASGFAFVLAMVTGVVLKKRKDD